MRINIVVKAGERLRQKIKYGFNLLFQPLRAEIIFSDEFLENAINIAYGDGPLFGKGKALCLNPSSEFEDCITDSRLPDISHLSWFDFAWQKTTEVISDFRRRFRF